MKTKIGDLLKEVNYGVIVHGCNAQGVMGSGFARQVKELYPKAFEKYARWCNSHYAAYDDHAYDIRSLIIGTVVPVEVKPNLVICNAITQFEYGTDRRHVDYEAIAEAFELISKTYAGSDIHFPMIGAGLGGGNWNIISTIIEETCKNCNLTLWIRK